MKVPFDMIGEMVGSAVVIAAILVYFVWDELRTRRMYRSREGKR